MESDNGNRSAISPYSNIGEGTTIWDFTTIRERVNIGINCSLGINVYIGPDVTIGNNCKIQNGAQVFDPAKIDSAVFIGPGAILTNDRFPRAVNFDQTIKKNTDWVKSVIVVDYGATICAGAIIVAPVKIGKWAFVAAGAVVTKDVKPNSLVAGIPAIQIGWVGTSGARLIEKNKGEFECPVTGEKYLLNGLELNQIN